MSSAEPVASVSFSGGERLTHAQLAIIDLCVHYARMLMLPKSVGQVYGVLFASDRPLCLDEIADLLGISRGGVSQGLRLLRGHGAVLVQGVPGDRRDFYVPELRLRRILAGVFRDRFEPGLRTAREMISRIDLPPGERPVVARRLESLRQWTDKARLPAGILERLL